MNVQVKTPEEMRQATRDGQEEAREADRLEKLQGDKVRVTRAMAALSGRTPRAGRQDRDPG